MCASILVACSPETPAPPPLPELVLPHLQSRATTILDVNAVASDALDPAALGSLLQESGFVAGSERIYLGRGRRLARVSLRVLLFASPTGAASYLAWLRSHASDLMGRTTQKDPLAVPGSMVFVHEPAGCCPKETFSVLVAWRRDTRVLFLLAAGPGADPRTVAPVADELDALV